MIGGLVEQQQIRLADQRPGQRRAPAPAAGERTEPLVAGQLHLRQKRVHRVFDVPAVGRVNAAVQRLEIIQCMRIQLRA